MFLIEALPSCYIHIFPATQKHTEKRQTVLFSATQTRNVEDLARVSLKKAPLYVGVDDDKQNSTVDGLEQVRWGIEGRVAAGEGGAGEMGD